MESVLKWEQSNYSIIGRTTISVVSILKKMPVRRTVPIVRPESIKTILLCAYIDKPRPTLRMNLGESRIISFFGEIQTAKLRMKSL